VADILPGTVNENEKRLCYLFDDAMKLRDAGDLVGARRMLASLVEQLRPEDVRLLSHAHLQLGYIFKLLGDHREREAHFRVATVVTPKREIASLGLYHALYHQGRLTEALQEMVRLLRLRDSQLYSELLTPRYAEGLSAEQQELIAEGRRLLARRRRN
jgi:tetratricopeptide (TPR) repeat protein